MNRQEIPPAEAFLRRVFKAHSHAKKTFGRLVELGCDPKMLRDWMFQISTSFTMLRSHGRGNRRYLAAWDFMVFLSEDELRKLHDQLLSVAVAIHDLSPTQLISHMKIMGFIREGVPFDMSGQSSELAPPRRVTGSFQLSSGPLTHLGNIYLSSSGESLSLPLVQKQPVMSS